MKEVVLLSVWRKTPLLFVIHLRELERKQQLHIAVGFSAVQRSLFCISFEMDGLLTVNRLKI